jgi:hypothetical protein
VALETPHVIGSEEFPYRRLDCFVAAAFNCGKNVLNPDQYEFRYTSTNQPCPGRGRDTSCPIPPSRPGEFHPEALTEPCVTVSSHTARAIH